MCTGCNNTDTRNNEAAETLSSTVTPNDELNNRPVFLGKKVFEGNNLVELVSCYVPRAEYNKVEEAIKPVRDIFNTEVAEYLKNAGMVENEDNIRLLKKFA